jgi:N-methylhydantoinase B
LRFERYGLAKDSGGPGKHRGGLATEMKFEVFAPNTRVTARNRDRTVFAGWGMRGGKVGANSAFWLNPGSNRAFNLKNTDIVKVGPGDVVYVACGGASGYGDPLQRDPAKVLLDVRRGYVSAEKAREDYGVVIANGAVDAAATAALRKARVAEEPRGAPAIFDYGAARDAHEAVWTEKNYATLADLLAAQPVHWRFYLKHRVFDAIAAMPENERKGDGSEVARVFARLVEEFPQLAAQAAE